VVRRLSGIIDLAGSRDANKVIEQEKLLLDTHCVGIPPAHQWTERPDSNSYSPTPQAGFAAEPRPTTCVRGRKLSVPCLESGSVWNRGASHAVAPIHCTGDSLS